MTAQQPHPYYQARRPAIVADFTECLGVPSDPAACTENLPEPGQG